MLLLTPRVKFSRYLMFSLHVCLWLSDNTAAKLGWGILFVNTSSRLHTLPLPRYWCLAHPCFQTLLTSLSFSLACVTHQHCSFSDWMMRAKHMAETVMPSPHHAVVVSSAASTSKGAGWRAIKVRTLSKNNYNRATSNPASSFLSHLVARRNSITRKFAIGPGKKIIQISSKMSGHTSNLFLQSPAVKILAKIWHPNIDRQTGACCVESLKRLWSPITSMFGVLVRSGD